MFDYVVTKQYDNITDWLYKTRNSAVIILNNSELIAGHNFETLNNFGFHRIVKTLHLITNNGYKIIQFTTFPGFFFSPDSFY